jgi:hypothetical protein
MLDGYPQNLDPGGQLSIYERAMLLERKRRMSNL